MNINILDQMYDEVIRCKYLTVSVTYEDAVKNLCPLMDKLDFQRNPLRKSFYERLEHDILNCCIMPNITIAIKVKNPVESNQEIDETFLNNNLCNAFILDGIQRLNTMQRVSTDEAFPKNRPLYCNILICDSMDRLLYRMITLNNGQKPMTTRHQIEILASNLFDFDKLAILAVSEKDKGKRKTKQEDSMSKEVLIKGYLAYVSGSINIDNQKIIEEKMNELIAEQIMESNIANKDSEFRDVIEYIDSLLSDEYLNSWFKVPNNFIAFCASMNKAFDLVKELSVDEITRRIALFEDAFSALDVSKIRLGQARRKLVFKFFNKIDELGDYSTSKLIDYISQEI